MIGHDDLGAGAHPQVLRAHLDPPGLEALDFPQKDLGVQDHAVADAADRAGMKNAGGDQVENELVPAHHQGMPGVVAPLVTHHDLGLFGQKINDLPFTLITPLGAYHYYVRQTVPPFFNHVIFKSTRGQSQKKNALPEQGIVQAEVLRGRRTAPGERLTYFTLGTNLLG